MSVDNDEKLPEVYETLIRGGHILQFSWRPRCVRSPLSASSSDPNLFIMPRNMPPAPISKPADLVIYRISDASPVDENAPRGHLERYIHSEIYVAYPHVNSVLHRHTAGILPYANSSLSTPVFDISDHYLPNDHRNLLINNSALGKHLASYFTTSSTTNNNETCTRTSHSVVLMRGHGFTIIAPSVRDCVFRGLYTVENAKIQTDTMLITVAHSRLNESRSSDTTGTVLMQSLREDEIGDSETGTASLGPKSGERAWALWVCEVEVQPLYNLETVG